MKSCARTLFALTCVLLVSIGCASNDFVPDTCPLGERRCRGRSLEECVDHLVTHEWEIYRDCSATGQACSNDAAVCDAAGLSTPCCH